MSTLGETLSNFDRALASSSPTDAETYLTQLETLSEDNPNNRRIAKAYEPAKAKYEQKQQEK
jgi:hypothetical protein